MFSKSILKLPPKSRAGGHRCAKASRMDEMDDADSPETCRERSLPLLELVVNCSKALSRECCARPALGELGDVGVLSFGGMV